MRKILISSTALSLALAPMHSLPVYAQSLAEDGSVLGPDGTVLCQAAEGVTCDLDAITAELKAAEEAAAAEAAAAEAEKAAAEDAAKAEAEAAAKAEAEAAAQAEVQAEAEKAAAEEAAKAEAEAAATAEAEALAKAEAEKAAAEEAAKAEAEAANEAAAEATAKAEADAKAAAEAAEKAASEAAAEAEAAAAEAVKAAEEAEASVEEPAAEAEAPATEAEAPATEEAAEAVEPVVEPAPAEEAAPAPETAEVPPAVEGEAAAPEAAAETAKAEPAPAPVDAPVPEEEAVQSLTDILNVPQAVEGAAVEGVPGAAAAAAFLAEEGKAEGEAAAETTAEAVEAPQPTSVIKEMIDQAATRSSEEEFAAAPVEVSKGKKSGLSDLEKVGLVALGALAVGAVLNQGKADERRVVTNSGDRVILEDSDGSYRIYKDDDAVLRRPGVETVTESYADGSTRTVVTREDGSRVATIRDASGRVLRRSHFDRDGVERLLIDDLRPEEPIIVSELPRPRPDRVMLLPTDSDAALKAEMAALEAESIGRKFSLRQIREIPQVRALAAMIEVDTITFDTNSSVIRASEARKLADLGRLMQDLLASNPSHVFLIEGHTDAVGKASSNLLLSDRRAESLALALTEYFAIPPENLVVQGYGEAELKIDTEADERANRRVVARLVTPLMRKADLR